VLVRLNNTGNVLLSGDLAHFRENYEYNQAPLSSEALRVTSAAGELLRTW